MKIRQRGVLSQLIDKFMYTRLPPISCFLAPIPSPHTSKLNHCQWVDTFSCSSAFNTNHRVSCSDIAHLGLLVTAEHASVSVEGGVVLSFIPPIRVRVQRLTSQLLVPFEAVTVCQASVILLDDVVGTECYECSLGTQNELYLLYCYIRIHWVYAWAHGVNQSILLHRLISDTTEVLCCVDSIMCSLTNVFFDAYLSQYKQLRWVQTAPSSP